MSESNSSGTAATKPAKPYPDFPLFPHATKRWAKKIRGEMHYFGPWADPDAALAKYLAQKDALHAGRQPKPAAEALTVKGLGDRFLNHKRHLVDTRELTPRSWEDYRRASQTVADVLGKNRLVADVGPSDFEKLRKHLAKTLGPVSLGNEIQRIRCLFKYAFDEGLIAAPVRYGQSFKRPSRKTLRIEKSKKGARMFEWHEVGQLLGLAPWVPSPVGVQLRAMILLGLNCGFGNHDCGTLPLDALDLDGGWIDFPRPKTGIKRRCPLWPETVQALREVIARRKEPKDAVDAPLLFITKRGDRWAKDDNDNPVSKEMRKLLDKLGINGSRGFYALRHTFETVGGEAKDQIAVDAIMGHADASMGGVYRERISDERLKAVAGHVKGWLFGIT